MVQPLGRQLLAGPGDVVLRVNKQRDLENIAGKADLFGRKTNEGFTELHFAGVEATGEVVFYRKDVQIISNETTMSRYAGTIQTGSVRPTANWGATFATTTLGPAHDFHIVTPADTVIIRMAPGEARLPVEGYGVEILRAGPNSLEYQVVGN